MIAIIYTNKKDWDRFLQIIQLSFEDFGYQVEKFKFDKLLVNFPNKEDIDAIIYINFDENIIPKHQNIVFSLMPECEYENKNINYRIKYDNLFSIESVSGLALNANLCMYDIKSMIYKITKILRDQKEMMDASRIYSVWN